MLYHPEGGGLSYYFFWKLHPKLADPQIDVGSNEITLGWWGDTYGTYNNGGTSLFDYLYSIRITKPFCDYINKRLGNAAVDSHSSSGSTASPTPIGFQYALGGGLSNSNTGLAGNAHAIHLAGKDMGCFNSSNPAPNAYYFVALIYLR